MEKALKKANKSKNKQNKEYKDRSKPRNKQKGERNENKHKNTNNNNNNKENKGNKQNNNNQQNKQQNNTHNNNNNNNYNTGSGRDFLRSASVLLASTVATKATSLLGDDRDTSSGGVTGVFDLYLFAQSWAPRFCCTNLQKCEAESMTGISELSTHGLWPAYNDADKDGRTYPAFCSKSRSTSIPGVPHSRADHEWDKHGTCTGLSRASYFQEEDQILTREEMRKGLEITKENSGNSVPIADVATEFGGVDYIAFRSDKFCRLEEITTCWEKLPGGRVGKQIPCPPHVLASARNNSVMEHNCTKVWLDTPNECKFVTKQLLRELKSVE